MSGRRKGGKIRQQRERPTGRPCWQLQHAKAHFSELVRRARTEGPQLVTVRGKDAVVVMDAAELERLRAAAKPREPLVQFLQGLGLDTLDIRRDSDRGRDVTF